MMHVEKRNSNNLVNRREFLLIPRNKKIYSSSES